MAVLVLSYQVKHCRVISIERAKYTRVWPHIRRMPEDSMAGKEATRTRGVLLAVRRYVVVMDATTLDMVIR